MKKDENMYSSVTFDWLLSGGTFCFVRASSFHIAHECWSVWSLGRWAAPVWRWSAPDQRLSWSAGIHECQRRLPSASEWCLVASFSLCSPCPSHRAADRWLHNSDALSNWAASGVVMYIRHSRESSARIICENHPRDSPARFCQIFLSGSSLWNSTGIKSKKSTSPAITRDLLSLSHFPLLSLRRPPIRLTSPLQP